VTVGSAHTISSVSLSTHTANLLTSENVDLAVKDEVVSEMKAGFSW
jgi:hypothetical protein